MNQFYSDVADRLEVLDKGLGKDIWMVSPDDITSILYVGAAAS